MAATRTRNKRATARTKKPATTVVQPAASTLPAQAPAPAPAPETAAAVPEMDWEALARFADARDRAADIVDTAREQALVLQTQAEERAARTVTDTHEQTAVLLADAHTRAEALTAGAQEEATAQRAAAATESETLREEAQKLRGEADRLLAEARDRADEFLAQARAQVVELTELAAAEHQATALAVAELRRLAEADLTEIGALVEARRTEAGQILARAREEADTLLAAAHKEVEQARERHAQLARAAAEQYDARRTEAEALYADAVEAAAERRREADAHVAAVQTEAETARAELRAELRELGEKFDSEAATKRKALAEELAGLKTACDQQREKLRTEATTVAQELRAAAQKEAARITAEAERKAAAVTERAQADEARARRLLTEAREAKQAASKWRGWRQNLGGKLWKAAPWVALAAGVGLAASGEYELARMVGINEYVAPLLPVSIDVYCVTAFRAKRDIPAALALMASANVTYHLSEQAHIVQDGQSAPWQLTTFVVLIFVAVIWRVHTLMHNDGTDGHGGNGTPARTGTHRRTDGTDSVTSGRTQPARGGLYAANDGGRPNGTGVGHDSTDPAHAPSHPSHHDAGEGALTSSYSDRTYGVHTTPDGAARTGAATPRRTGTTHAAVQGRVGAVSVRTQPDREPVQGGRPGTTTGHSRTTGTGGTGRTGGTDRPGTPARTDAELLPLVQALPRDEDGYVTLYRVRTDLSVNQPRAVRLLKETGLLRPEDADKYLT
ncbi:hypothetical protein NEH16_32815 [Streptomyces drozdowiczii]|uniref:Large alanine-rich protein n=1 Tax=Streptomyces drozdowiczii TaxID=202862 RepID=A0ABY6Q222_9ACTN|nr:hypothetical protein [Streptomyces drozdowiczii]UZK58223.1 hypothetical protein NEH16_32815 [Streptomyces drozdowiczii]